MNKNWGIAALSAIAGLLVGLAVAWWLVPRPERPAAVEAKSLPLSAVDRKKAQQREVAARAEEHFEGMENALETLRKEGDATAGRLEIRERLLLRMLGDLAPVNGSSVYNLAVQRRYSPFLAKSSSGPERGRVLEIGPGINLGTGLLFSLEGAEKYYGLDIYQDPDLYSAPQYEALVALLQDVAPERIKRTPESIFKVSGGLVSFDPERVEYLCPHESYDISLPDGSLDLIYSHSTLEHVSDPERTIEAIARTLRSGGITAHHIDLRDHRDFSKPLEFLKVSTADWRRKFPEGGSVPTFLNRWRASDFKRALEKNGFQVITVQPTTTCDVTAAMREAFAAPYNAYELSDLQTLSVMVVARKR
jgi:SAM-dependent methyltransferase